MSEMRESKNLGSARLGLVAPSGRLLRAAVSGLLALGAGACGDDEGSSGEHHEELTDDELDSLCEGRVEDALEDQDKEELCADMVAEAREDAQNMCEPDLEEACADMVSSARAELEESVNDLEDQVGMLEDQVAAGEDEIAELKERGRALLLTAEEKTISSETKEYTFAELTEMCDDRNGYIEVHGACGGHNSCAGFSYGDWGPDDATLTEHTCAAANGCLGLSCVDTAKDQGRTGKEIYEETEYGDEDHDGPGTCSGCHAWNDPDGNQLWTPGDVDMTDLTKFVVFVQLGSTRTADNWLDRTAEEQERVVAFGAKGVTPEGNAYSGMAPYHQHLSRQEIHDVVEYLRGLDPIIEYYRYPKP